jgi:SAM-dependent methyltransferase
MAHHHHHAPSDVDWASRIGVMERDADLFADVELEIARWLAETPARRIVDVGCGVASMAQALTVVFPDAEVTARDRTPEMLAAARRRLDRTAAGARVAVEPIDLDADDLGPWTADLIWGSLVVHHLPDQVEGLRRLRARLEPGGRLALGEGGLPVRTLPWDLGVGRPGLEFRLDVAQNEWFTGMREGLDATVAMPVGWAVALADAGFADVRTRSFIVELPVPLQDDARAAVVDRLRMFLDRFGEDGTIDGDDIATLEAITDESNPSFIGNRPDLQYLWARTVHVGRVAGSGP